jgi:adenylate cyclase
MAVDWEAEGLLEGLEGEEREARLRLLEELTRDGASLDEVKRAASHGRLVLQPVERVLGAGDAIYSLEDVAERSGLDVDFISTLWGALGVARPQPGEKVFSEMDLESACNVKRVLEAGMPEQGVLEISRVMGQTLSRLAEAIGRSFAQAFLREGDSEHDLALRYAEAARELEPLVGPMVLSVLRLHQREDIRRAAFTVDQLEAGQLGAQDVAVCFADLVDFTKLGERVPANELGAVAGQLDQLAVDVASPPVRLVKTLGDAAMLVSREPEALVDAALDLVDAAERQGEDFPPLRAGLAWGPALQRAGDWYGQPVNRASRLTGFARPSSVVADKGLHDAAEGGYSWSFAGKRRFKGIKGELPVYRVRRVDTTSE